MKTLRAFNLRGLAPDEAAAAWIVRIDEGPLSPEAQAEFDAWREESTVNAAAFARAEAAWRLFDDPQGDPTLDALRVSALAAGKEPRRGMWAGIAAGVAVLVAVFAFNPDFLPFQSKEDATQLAANSESTTGAAPQDAPESGEFATARGERRTVQLADGTAITLNTDSAIRVAYADDRRLVHLLGGQALFEVAKDPHRPFVVQAGDRQVTALGTIFEVRLDADRVKVTLVEGKVVVDEVEDRSGDSASVMVPAVLAPGQALVVVDGVKPVLAKVDIDRELRWREGFVEFNDVTLADAVAEMNRYSSEQLVLDDPATGSLRVSGVFRTGSPERFAAILGELLPVRHRALPGGDVELSTER